MLSEGIRGISCELQTELLFAKRGTLELTCWWGCELFRNISLFQWYISLLRQFSQTFPRSLGKFLDSELDSTSQIFSSQDSL